MKLTLVRGDNAAVIVGGQWVIEFYTTDDRYLIPSSPIVTIKLPDDSQQVATFVEGTDSGVYKVRFPINNTGRFVGTITADDTQTRFITAEALAVTGQSGWPSPGDVVSYLSEGTQEDSKWTTQQIDEALAAEKAAQVARCRIPAAYPPDLRRALLRRVQRALGLSAVPFTQAFGDEGNVITPTNDPEVRRLEAPYRRVILG